MSDHLCYRENLISDFLCRAMSVSNQEGFMHYFWEASSQSFTISTWNILMTQLDLQNPCLNLLKMTALSQQISLKWMFIQNEINLLTFSMKILPSFLLLCSPFLNSLLGFNPVGFYLLKDTPFKGFFISKFSIPVLVVSLIPFLVSLSGISFVFPIWSHLQCSTDIASLDLNRIILITLSYHNSTEFHLSYFLPLLPISCLYICHTLEFWFLKISC